ncbi:MAG: hypothetical protein LBI84_09330 [Propionibacteriaceae bacterium]|nr:hypothetical protein [Propionibacteriaceae bacterium]
MTGCLRLWAVPVATVQQIPGAPPELAARLRQVAADHAPVRAGRPRALIDKLGPLLRRPSYAPVIDPAALSLPDADAIVAGRFIPPERLDAAWRLFEFWLDDLSAARLSRPASAAEVEQADFDLARAGVPSPGDLRHLWQRGFALPLRPPPGLAIGYLEAARVQAAAAVWQDRLDGFDLGGSAGLVQAVLGFLARWPEWTAAAPGFPLDLVARWGPQPADG